MADEKKWKPELGESALKQLIIQTIESAGSVDPAQLPSKIRNRIKDRSTGDLDIDAYIQQVLKETKSKS